MLLWLLGAYHPPVFSADPTANCRRRYDVSQPGYVTYLRTSNADIQAPERSQDAQRRDIRQRLLNQCDLPFIEEYIDNYSGTSADRKNYQRMLKDVRAGKVSH